MKLLLVSDIHGNKEALKAVLAHMDTIYRIDSCALLGDVIDYGMHSNEVVGMLRGVKYPLTCNIRGNHEQAVITQDYGRFSSERGRRCAQYTCSVLSPGTWDYIRHVMAGSGMTEFALDGKRCLAVHGSLSDPYWKSIFPGQGLEEYRDYDYVFSGHSHLPHYFETFYETDAPFRRNKKKTVFINPGSVGQPRNLDPLAQCALLDTVTGSVTFIKVPYDIRKEQEAYTGQVDDFYRKRLEAGV